MAGTYSLKRFLKKKILVERNTKINKKRNSVVKKSNRATLKPVIWEKGRGGGR